MLPRRGAVVPKVLQILSIANGVHRVPKAGVAIRMQLTVLHQALHRLALQHRGVIGKHTLQITDEGLIERTDVNEAISKWAGLHKVVSGPKYLYIYVTESNAHIVPKRYFPSHGIEGFAAELRSRAAKARGLS